MSQDSLKLLPEYLHSISSGMTTGDLFILIQKLVVAILIGIFIGLEREHARPKDEKIFAGIRTFPLIAIFGFVSALVSSLTTYWFYCFFFISLASLVTASHIFSAKEGRLGGTSEVSIFVVFLLGSLVFWNFIILASIIAIVTTLFLTLKIQLHTFAGKVSEEDIYAVLKFALITVIILPLLPDKTYGPLNVLNPRTIWYMVILVSGIGFIGYILIKIAGENRGIHLTGLLGGLVSSTAVAYSLSRKSKLAQSIDGNFAGGIILASTIMYLRVFVVILVVNSSLILKIWLPLIIFALSGLLSSYTISKKFEKKHVENIEMKNPFELKSALLFGLLFGIILFISKAAEVNWGSGGIYAASAVAGITSVDAIIISLSKFASGSLSQSVTVAAIIIALISNNLIKSIIVYFLGNKPTKKYTIAGLGVMNIVSLIYLLFIIP